VILWIDLPKKVKNAEVMRNLPPTGQGDEQRAKAIFEGAQEARQKLDERHTAIVEKMDTLVASMNSTDRLSKNMLWLTWGMFALTVAIFALTFYLAYDTYEKNKRDQQDREDDRKQQTPNP
jgi:ABC-type uncharacterized transport system fused permease/ATPase subunit